MNNEDGVFQKPKANRSATPAGCDFGVVVPWLASQGDPLAPDRVEVI
jgi:hypothetical protein